MTAPHLIEQGRRTRLNAVCVTVSGVSLHWPANRAGFNPIEQMCGMGMVLISREQCNTPEELSVLVQLL
jgi:hypothetical protein